MKTPNRRLPIINGRIIARCAALAIWCIAARHLSADTIGPISELEYRYVTSDVSGSHTTTPGVSVFGLNHDGVGDLVFLTTPTTGIRGTGSLLQTGRHVLTAAHVVTNANTNVIGSFLSGTIKFETTSGSVIIPYQSITVDPLYNGDATEGHDIAIVTLSQTAPIFVPRYEIYRGNAEIGVDSIKVGYGQSGIGTTGTSILSGTKRAGKNEYDVDARSVLSALGSGVNPFDGGALPGVGLSLAYDFDDGTVTRNAMDGYFPIDFNSDLGFGVDEVNSAPGDSGGPTFIIDSGIFKIAGVTSYGFGFNGNPDISPGTNSSFGEIAVDMRVAAEQIFIDGAIPEPGSCVLMAIGIGLLCCRYRPARLNLTIDDGQR